MPSYNGGSGGGPGGPAPLLFLDQTEARRAETLFWRPPLPLAYSQGLDPVRLIRLVAKALTNSHHIRHFRENHHFQRALLSSHLNFS